MSEPLPLLEHPDAYLQLAMSEAYSLLFRNLLEGRVSVAAIISIHNPMLATAEAPLMHVELTVFVLSL